LSCLALGALLSAMISLHFVLGAWWMVSPAPMYSFDDEDLCFDELMLGNQGLLSMNWLC